MKKKKILKRLMWITISVFLFCVLLYIGSNIFIVNYASRYILTMEEAAALEADCALVLGAQVWDTRLSPILEDRVSTGIALYEAGATNRLLMSGDHGREAYDEVNSMKRYAVDQGVPAGDVFMDHAGFSTYESMYRAKEIFQVESIIVVTQKFHIYRAIFLARMMGMEAYGVIADLRPYQRKVYNNIRESLARVKDLGMVLFKPKPQYLGEAIPIWGDGSLTDDTDDYLEAGGDLYE